MKELQHRLKYVNAISPQLSADNTAVASAVLDRAGCIGATQFIVTLGAVGLSGSSYVVTLTEGDLANGSDQAAVAASLVADSLPTILGTGGAGQVKSFGYIGNKRYVKLTVTPAANTASGAGTYLQAVMAMEMRGQPVGATLI